jgi:hypothetical protein
MTHVRLEMVDKLLPAYFPRRIFRDQIRLRSDPRTLGFCAARIIMMLDTGNSCPVNGEIAH